MSLEHDFLLLDREVDGDWELTWLINDPRSLHLHDDLVRYMADTLAWVPTFNPSRKEPYKGLCMYGTTIIATEGIAIAEQVFRGWADLFAIGPPVLALTGSYGWVDDGAASNSGAEKAAQQQGSYEQLAFDCEEVVSVLRRLAEYSAQVRLAGGRLFLLHQGI